MSDSEERAGTRLDLPVLSMTKALGPMLASERFSKVLHSRNLSRYRIAHRHQIVVDPMLLWDGSIGIQRVVDAGLVSPDYRVYTPSEDVDPTFLAYLVRSPTMLHHYQGGARGTNVRRNRIARSDFFAIPVVLPPLIEQREIAAVVSSMDAVIDATQAVIDQLHVVKKAMMIELLTRGLPGRHTRFKQTEIGEVPESWEIVGILDVAALPSGQVDPRNAPYASMPLIAPNHIESGTGRLLAVESAAAQGAISGKYEFNPLDIVYSKIRPYLRKAWLADRDGLCSADMYPLRPSSRVDSGFLLVSLLGERFSEFATSMSMRTGIPKINREELSQYRIALPPLEEQRQISSLERSITAREVSEHAVHAALVELKSAAMCALLTGEVRILKDVE